MDHAKAYAQSIAAAIRHKKAMKAEPKEEDSEIDLAPAMEGDIYEEAPVDPKAARRERIKAILAR